MGPLAWALLTATATTAPSVVILPAITVDRGNQARAVSPARRDAFDEALREAAAGTFLARGWTVVDRAETERTIGDRRCDTSQCAHAVARETGATAWLASVIVESGAACHARATLFDTTAQKVAARHESPIEPCTAERMLIEAEDLGRAVSEGPRYERPATLALTPLSIPHLAIRDLPALVDTTTIARDPEALSKALALYGENRFALATSEDGFVLAVRGQSPISDCELFAIAGVRPSREERDACEGNLWELGWITLPIGALLFVPGAVNAGEGDSVAPLVVSLALLTIGPGLAWLLDEDPPDAASGEHVVPLPALELLIERANRTLQEHVGLTDAELRVHGY